jgi:hypothetical protein
MAVVLFFREKEMKIVIYFISVLLSVSIYFSDGFRAYREISTTWQDNILTKYANYDPHDQYFSKCNLLSGTIGHYDKTCINERETDIFLWGDSHAAALSPGLREKFSDKIISQITTSGCRISFGKDDVDTFRSKQCSRSNHIAFNAIREIGPQVVIIAQEKEHSLIDLNYLVSSLESFGVKKLVIVGPVPQWRPSLPLAVVQFNEKPTYLVSKYFDRKIDKENNLMREKVSLFRKNKKMEVEYIDLISHFCRSGASNDEDYKCNVWTTPERNDLIIFDYGHLTQQGSKYAVKLLLDDN